MYAYKSATINVCFAVRSRAIGSQAAKFLLAVGSGGHVQEAQIRSISLGSVYGPLHASVGGHGHGHEDGKDADPNLRPVPPFPFWWSDEPRHPISPLGQNQGPPVTMDMALVPQFPYEEEHRHIQRKYNMYLAFAVACFAASCYLAYIYDALFYRAWGPLDSYKNRHKYSALYEQRQKDLAEEWEAKRALGVPVGLEWAADKLPKNPLDFYNEDKTSIEKLIPDPSIFDEFKRKRGELPPLEGGAIQATAQTIQAANGPTTAV